MGASSTTSSSGGTTFPAPMPPMDPSIGMGPGGLEQGSKTGNGIMASTQPQNRTGANPINSQQSAQPPPTNGTQRDPQRRISGSGPMAGTGNGNTMPITTPGVTSANPSGLSNTSIGNNPQSVDSGIGLGSPRSITSASSTTLYSPKIQGTSPSLIPGSDNSPEKATSS